QLIRQILDFSRQSVSQPRPLDLVPFLKETTKFLERTIPENVRLTLEIDVGEHVVNADPTQMQQVVTNLAVNARDAMPQGGELAIRLATLLMEPGQSPPCAGMHPGQWVALSVSDTGMGIPSHVRERMFEPFFTTKKTGKGTGLGLAQVYGIVTQHGGFIDVSSQVGKGTTFTIYLPALLSEVEVEKESGVESVPHGQGETILLVEDEPEVREAIQAILTHLGYRVLPAVNGREALNVYERRHADIALVVTDLVMPEMDGIALIKALRTRDPRVKIIVMSGYPLKAEHERETLKGVVEWIQKPVALPQLAAVTKRLIEQQ
ncbi:MAG: response regulator, partial [Acidobacteria bacterium]